MKILYISSTNSSAGSSIALINICNGMKKSGHDVYVITSHEGGPLLKLFQDNDIQYEKSWLTLTIWPFSKNIVRVGIFLVRYLFRMFTVVPQICKVIRKFKPDIVHSNVGPMSYGAVAAKKCGVKHVWHQREYQDLDFNMRFFPNIRYFDKLRLDSNNYNICITKGIYEHRYYRPSKDVVIYDGVFSQEACSLPIYSKKDNYILFTGRVETGKRLIDLLTVFPKFNELYPDVILKVAGSCDAKSRYFLECKKLVENYGLSEKVEFLGARPDIYNLAAHALMQIVPSQYEGFGFITAEAMLNGCPVVGRNTAGTKDQFDRGLELTGSEIGFRYNTLDEMLRAMCEVMTTDTSDMCRRARETVLTSYTLEQNVQNLKHYYRFVLADEESSR